jgi:3-mercaptopropionate dioxygenase
VASGLTPLRTFVTALVDALDGHGSEPEKLERGADLLRALVAHDDWLPPQFAEPNPDRYSQYLLHCDSRERFSVVSFVWGPGQATPIHDHTVWGLVGVLRGAERVESFIRAADGTLKSEGAPVILNVGEVDKVGPGIGDIHRVANAYDDRPSISIHVYGANIGAVERSTYDAAGRPKTFISGYANTVLPNIWDRSNDV